MNAIETVLDVLVPLEAKRQSVGSGTLFELVFEDPEDRSKNVTVFWYTEMDGTGKKDTVDYSDDEMAVVLSVDSEGVCLVDIEGEIISLQVYNCSVMVTRRWKSCSILLKTLNKLIRTRFALVLKKQISCLKLLRLYL